MIIIFKHFVRSNLCIIIIILIFLGKQLLSMHSGDHIFFQKEITAAELKPLLNEQEGILKQKLGKYCSEEALRATSDERVRLLKHNYQGLIHQLSKLHRNTNDYSLHLLVTISLHYRALGKTSDAKEALLKAMPFLNNPHSDSLLQAICLNHLANYYKSRNKPWKSLKFALKGVQIMQMFLREKKGMPKQQRQQAAILLIVLLIYSKNCLSEILQKSQSKTLKHQLQFVNYIGYKNCCKYLGSQSVFNKFTPTQKYFHLPVFKVQEQKNQPQNGKEGEIVNQLQKIFQILKNKQNPEFVVINTGNNVESPSITNILKQDQSISIHSRVNQTFLPPKQPQKPKQKPQQPKKQTPSPLSQLFKALVPQPQPQPQQIIPKITINNQQLQKQTSHHYVCSDESQNQSIPPLLMASETVSFNKWEVKFRLQKELDQRMGNLIMESINRKMQNKVVITEDKLQKIIAQINKQDKLPYEILIQELYEQQLIEYYIKPFFDINQIGKMSIVPHSIGLLQPFQIKFLNQTNFIFLNHIRHHSFRVAIAPSYSCKSIYLNIQLSPNTLVQYFSFEEEAVDFINAIFKSINNSPANTTPLQIKDKNRLCKVISEPKVLQYLSGIISQFQSHLLNREDETSVNQIIENQLFYYKYEQIKKDKLGIYYFIRYLPSINYFDIYLKNNYQTYSIDGKIKARGNALYKAQNFLQDFGIPLKSCRKSLFAFIEMIAKKYYLLTFQKPLSNSDSDRYMQNAILQLPITQSCFKNKFVKRGDYFIILTISLVTINNQTPLGIKVIEYDPVTCKTRGFLIHIVANQWVRPYRKPVVTLNNLLFRTYINQFPIRSEYFLPEWLEKIGFTTLFQKILDPTSQLYLQKNINKLLRGKILIKIFNNDDSIE